MAEPHAHSQPIQTYGPAPHNRNIWPHNSRATVFCLRFWPILLSVLVAVVYPLLSEVLPQPGQKFGSSFLLHVHRCSACGTTTSGTRASPKPGNSPKKRVSGGSPEWVVISRP